MVIYAKDIQTILRCSQATASRKLQQVKDALDRKKHQYVTITEFCEYYGVPAPKSNTPNQLSLF